jgi:uncharacterized protein (DUF885 family)
MQLRGERWRFHNYPVNPLFGVQSDLPHLMTQIPAGQRFDRRRALHCAARRDPAQARPGDRWAAGPRAESLIPPKFVVEKVVDQVNAFVAPGAKGNALTVGLREKLEKTSIDETARAGLLARAEQAVGASVIPAYRRLAAYLETLRAKARCATTVSGRCRTAISTTSTRSS